MFSGTAFQYVAPFHTQLLKWIGNKQRFAHEIAAYFPTDVKTYFEPFLRSGAVLAAMQPWCALGSDAFGPLMDIWKTFATEPETVVRWYGKRHQEYNDFGGKGGYERIKARYNAEPNGADLLFLCRSCYGGVVQFRKSDGYMSTPCGAHTPITPESFARRVQVWRRRTAGTTFEQLDFREAMQRSGHGDLVYCDPPYTHSQTILYQGQDFDLDRLMEKIASCKEWGPVSRSVLMERRNRAGCTVVWICPTGCSNEKCS